MQYDHTIVFLLSDILVVFSMLRLPGATVVVADICC
jgi:hypothetical protein